MLLEPKSRSQSESDTNRTQVKLLTNDSVVVVFITLSEERVVEEKPEKTVIDDYRMRGMGIE